MSEIAEDNDNTRSLSSFLVGDRSAGSLDRGTGEFSEFKEHPRIYREITPLRTASEIRDWGAIRAITTGRPASCRA